MVQAQDKVNKVIYYGFNYTTLNVAGADRGYWYNPDGTYPSGSHGHYGYAMVDRASGNGVLGVPKFGNAEANKITIQTWNRYNDNQTFTSSSPNNVSAGCFVEEANVASFSDSVLGALQKPPTNSENSQNSNTQNINDRVSSCFYADKAIDVKITQGNGFRFVGLYFQDSGENGYSVKNLRVRFLSPTGLEKPFKDRNKTLNSPDYIKIPIYTDSASFYDRNPNIHFNPATNDPLESIAIDSLGLNNHAGNQKHGGLWLDFAVTGTAVIEISSTQTTADTTALVSGVFLY
jgi:hypothetical protein